MVKDVKNKIRILFLEDQEDDNDLAKRAIRKGGIVFDSIRVDSRPEFEKGLEEFQPDVIISDHSLPQFNSIEAMNIKAVKAPDIPFILVTGAVSDEFAAQCIKLGADDYILKSNLSRLPSSIQNALEHKHTEKLRVDAERALYNQNIELKRAHKEIDSFVYSISHNLRAPIASVLGLISLARQSKSLTEVVQYVDMMEKSVVKLDDTIKEILDYARNERVEINLESIDIKALIEECLARLQYIKGFDQIDKQITVTGGSSVLLDRSRLSIVLLNLFSNAIKYRDEQKEYKLLRIKVNVTNEKVLLEITDNGIGILADRIPLVFNMFYRGTERSDGAGLGLYIAKGVVEKLGGSIRVESQFELLTTITVSLPNYKQH